MFFFSISRISITSKSGSIGSLTSSSKRRNRVEFSGSENSIFNLMTSAFVTIRPAVWSFAALSLLYYIIAGRFPQKYPTSSDLLLSSQQLLLDVRNGTENKTKQDVKIETKTNCCSFNSLYSSWSDFSFFSPPVFVVVVVPNRSSGWMTSSTEHFFFRSTVYTRDPSLIYLRNSDDERKI